MTSNGHRFSDAFASLAGGMICFAGSGGKTTLAYALGGILGRESRVLLTACTRLYCPAALRKTALTVAEDPLDVPAVTAPGLALAARAHGPERNPDYLYGYSREEVDGLYRRALADWLLVESDGAARRPLKAPAGNEPLVPSLAGAVVTVVGAAGFFQPLAPDHVFRHEVFAALSGLPYGAPVSPGAVARVITHPRGPFGAAPRAALRLVFINRIDLPGGPDAARAFAEAVGAAQGERIDAVYAGNARDAELRCLRLYGAGTVLRDSS